MTLKEIKFEDIREGDKIRTELVYAVGVTQTIESVVRKTDAGYFISLKGGWLVAQSDYTYSDLKVTHYLIERIDPKDHLVVSDSAAGTDIETGILLTETEAKARAEEWNGRTTTGRKYRAVKVNL